MIVEAVIAQRFALVYARMAGFLISAPPFNTMGATAVVRAGLAFFLSLLIFPTLRFYPGGVAESAWALGLAREMGAGLLLGGLVQMVFGAVQMAGHLVGAQMGFTFATFFDPDFNESTDVVSQLQRLLAVLLFLALEGHLRLLEALRQSFDAMPVGKISLTGGVAMLYIHAFHVLLLSSLKIAAPVLLTLWMLTVLLGVINRAAPPLNLFSLDFPVKTLLGLLGLSAGWPYFAQMFGRMVQGLYRETGVLFQALAGG